MRIVELQYDVGVSTVLIMIAYGIFSNFLYACASDKDSWSWCNNYDAGIDPIL